MVGTFMCLDFSLSASLRDLFMQSHVPVICSLFLLCSISLYVCGTSYLSVLLLMALGLFLVGGCSE